MKEIEVEYTIEIEKVIAYWQQKLESLWGKKQKMTKEIQMIDNTISFLKALDTAISNQVGVEIVIQDETDKAS